MGWKNFVTDYLTFTRKDRIGIIVVLTLVLAIFLLPTAFSNSAADTSSRKADTAWIATMKRLEQREEESNDQRSGQFSDDNSSVFQYDRAQKKIFGPTKG